MSDKESADKKMKRDKTPRKRIAKRLTGEQEVLEYEQGASTAAQSPPMGAVSQQLRWETISDYVRCRRHMDKPMVRFTCSGSLITWEWCDEGLNLYMFGDAVTPPHWVNKIYQRVYAATNREPATQTEDGSTLLDGSNITVIGGVLYDGDRLADPGKYLGYVLFGRSNFYVIHGGHAGDSLPKVKAAKPNKSKNWANKCTLCVPSIEEEEEVGSDPAPTNVDEEEDMEQQWIHQVPYPDHSGVADVTEWKDYWGTAYDKVEYPNWTFLRCRDTTVYAGHTVGGEDMRELFPDVVSRLNTLRLATSSRDADCLYTYDNGGHVFCPHGRQIFLIIRGYKLIMAHCLMIRSKNRLLSGQCVHYWAHG